MDNEQEKKQNDNVVTKSDYNSSRKTLRSRKIGTFKKLGVGLLIIILLGSVSIGIHNIHRNNKRRQQAFYENTAVTASVPNQIQSYDIINEKDYEVGKDYVIINNPDGSRIKIENGKRAYFIDDEGQFSGEVSNWERQNAYKQVVDIAKQDSSVGRAVNLDEIVDALEGNNRQNSSSNRNSVVYLGDGVYINTSTESGKDLQDYLDKNGYTIDGAKKAIDDYLKSRGYTWKDLQAIADKLGVPIEEVIKTILQSDNKEQTFNEMEKRAVEQGAVLGSAPKSSGTSGAQYSDSETEESSKSGAIQIITENVNPSSETQASAPVYTDPNKGQWLDSVEAARAGLNANNNGVDADTMSAIIEGVNAAAGGNLNDRDVTVAEKQEWFEQQQASGEVTSTGRLTRWDVAAGTIIPVTLYTQVNSDSPGNIIAYVRQNVYDTLTGTNIVIPKNSRLIANYNTSVSFGQKSLQIAWTNMITPDGYTFTLPGFAGISAEGASGVEGKVNNHFFSILGATILGTVIDYGADILATTIAGRVTKLSSNEMANLITALATGATSATQKVGQKYINKAINRQPTLTILNGSLSQVLVNRTVSFKR